MTSLFIRFWENVPKNNAFFVALKPCFVSDDKADKGIVISWKQNVTLHKTQV